MNQDCALNTMVNRPIQAIDKLIQLVSGVAKRTLDASPSSDSDTNHVVVIGQNAVFLVLFHISGLRLRTSENDEKSFKLCTRRLFCEKSLT